MRSAVLLPLTLALASAAPEAERAVDGRSVEMVAPRGGVLAVVFYSSECPISNEVSPQLVEVAKTHASPRLRMVGICVDFDLTDEQVKTHAVEHGLNYPCVVDRSGKLVRRFGGSITPEGVVVDDKGRILYRGRINDVYTARGKRNSNPSTRDLFDAVRLGLEGKATPPPWLKAIGCPTPEFPGE